MILITHVPVLQKEVIEYLAPKPNENFIDATVGLGGHSKAILASIGPRGKVLGIEADPAMYQQLKEQAIERLILVQDWYMNLQQIVENKHFKPVHGILFDLGLSSWHLEKSGRGFSFQRDEPLDMRYNTVQGSKCKVQSLTAEKVVGTWPEEELASILKDYGEERFAKRIARGIVEARKREPIKTTFQLVEIIKGAIPQRYQHSKIPRSKTLGLLRGKHPATRTFQALRIAVNNELANIQKTLPQALELLKQGGRLAVTSYHSLEDRIVKNFFKTEATKGRLKILTKKPITPSAAEVKKNPRSRSAKLRSALKI